MIDYARITIKAGDGGKGKVSFRHERNLFKGGPDGGDGGKGGSIWLETDKDLNTLKRFQFTKRFEAKSGEPGGKNKRTGGDGEDLTIKIPIGTVVKILDGKGRVLDFDKENQKVCLAKGGSGGRGNWYFRSPTLTTPKFAEQGKPGEEKELILELKLLADVGLIGLPNAGKSTILSVLTRAKPKIADYPFTTLEPNLGVLVESDVVIADIPGLIEGASKGKGLGIEFLRHIERCKLLVHVLDGAKILTAEKTNNWSLIKDYDRVRNELFQYSKGLLNKPEIIVLNKIDVLNEKQIKAAVRSLKKAKRRVICVSAATGKNMGELSHQLKFF